VLKFVQYFCKKIKLTGYRTTPQTLISAPVAIHWLADC